MSSFSVLVHSGEPERVYEAAALAAAARSQGKDVQLFFSGPALKHLASGFSELNDPSPCDILEECRGRQGFRIYACSNWLKRLQLDESSVLQNADAIVGLITFLNQAEGGQIIFI